jgi:uncharacterized protein (DUF488 family)
MPGGPERWVHPFHTIGHSTRPLGELVDLLRGAGVALLVDVRTVPRSRRNPEYNREVLPQSLVAFQIGYEHLAALGGLRGRQKDVPPEVNGYWQNESFHNYADYALGPAFRAGLDRLRDLGHERRLAMMCAEALWWQCHRRIIADHLLAAGESVLHILGPGKIEPAALTEGARVDAQGIVTYPGLL